MHPGQRWASEAEPELGLGTIIETDARRVTIHFPQAEETRIYAAASAPLRRVTFRTGDTVRTADGQSATIESINDDNDVLVYITDLGPLPEPGIHGAAGTASALDRLRAGLADSDTRFKLRARALDFRHRLESLPTRGFHGGRIQLIPHQLYIASRVAARHAPRVLLSDEVGLGKTIEASLILQRLLRTGRAQRVLILVPAALVHQWFVELYRRFHLTFTLNDADRHAESTADNPWLERQLFLAPIEWLASKPEPAVQAVQAEWDLLIVDEAHYLRGPAYHTVEALSRVAPGLLLLTATPEQFGAEGHFQRLHLLDPDRFPDFDSFQAESDTYHEAAAEAEAILAKHKDGKDGKDSDDADRDGIPDAAREPLRDLLDRYGTGRVLFRNTRQTIQGFPKRRAHPAPLDAAADRPAWLANLLRETAPDKVLVICNETETVFQLEAALKESGNPRVALFHAGLTLIQRDRNAAFFAEPDGARVLLCSEIGGEGRNFQFCHHLVLYDLPDHPERLEQRIGRLDRIGQRHPVDIHIPHVLDTADHRRFRWLHEALNAFQSSLRGAALHHQHFLDSADLGDDALIAAAREHKRDLDTRLEAGRDRLLELHSFDEAAALDLIDTIEDAESDPALPEFLLELFDGLRVHSNPIENRAWSIRPGRHMTESLPALPSDGITATFDRARALEREDFDFLTWDHPLVSESIDLLLGSETGTVSVVAHTGTEPRGIFLDCLFVLEVIAPAHLHLSRFLPPTPLRICVGADGQLADPDFPERFNENRALALLELPGISDILADALESAETRVQALAAPLIDAAREKIQTLAGGELKRLVDLRAVNPGIRDDEIQAATDTLQGLLAALDDARPRLDAIRLAALS